jgi:hypothetical protein
MDNLCQFSVLITQSRSIFHFWECIILILVCRHDNLYCLFRKENLELAVSLLQNSSKRMVEAVNKQIEKAIEIIMAANEDENNTLPEMKNRSALSNENRKLTQIVHLR